VRTLQSTRRLDSSQPPAPTNKPFFPICGQSRKLSLQRATCWFERRANAATNFWADWIKCSAKNVLRRKRNGNPAAALNTPQAASAIELGQIAFVANISCLYHVYVRGEAYLAAGQGSAAAEFQKIPDHGGIVWNCWTGALARLGLARANALQAKTSQGADADTARVRALAAYKDFLALWKDADPDIPILKEAKAEYAKLQ
jgi:hypothetical protein